jgi:CelD/BcsL family acetyltransferase involved in cellulose biosynthesis
VASLSDPRAVQLHAEAWDALPASTGPVGGSAWVRAWLDVYGADYHLAIGVQGASDAPEAVVPLVRRRARPWWLTMLGVQELLEPTDVRADDPTALRPIVEAVARRRLPIRLKRLPADSPLLPHLHAVYSRRAVVLSRQVNGTPTIPLDRSWLAPESHFNARRRSDLRTARRRAEKFGAVELSVEQVGPDEVGPLFEELVAVEASGWKTRAGTALARQPRMREFFGRYCVLAAEQGTLRLAFLRIDGRAAAFQLAVEQDDRYSLLKIGYGEEFARCSPGTLLMVHTVRWAAERGLQLFDFLGAEEPWTALWTQQVRPCVEVHVYPASPWSLLAAGDVGIELLLRALRRARAKYAP